MKAARRKLYAKPTQVTFTQTTVDCEIDRLWLRVTLRAAELGITLGEVARRMGVKPPRLNAMCGKSTITRAAFWRLSAALEMGSSFAHWAEPLPKVPSVSPEKMRKKLRRKLR